MPMPESEGATFDPAGASEPSARHTVRTINVSVPSHVITRSPRQGGDLRCGAPVRLQGLADRGAPDASTISRLHSERRL